MRHHRVPGHSATDPEGHWDASPQLAALGVALVTTVAVSLALAGSIHPLSVAVAHVLVGVCAVLALRLPDEALARAGRARTWFAVLLLLPAVLLLDLLPLPRRFWRFASPGLVEARPEATWMPASLVPERTVTEFAVLCLAVSFSTLVALWAAGGHRRRTGERAVVVLMGFLCLFALAHAGLGARSVLGVIPLKDPPDVFWAPFVNPNHLGSLLVFGMPIAVGFWFGRREPDRIWRLVAGVVLAAVGFLCIAIASAGVWLAVVVVACVAVSTARRPVRVRVAWAGALLVGSAAAFALWARFGDPYWVTSSLMKRWSQWRDQPRLFADHWLLGTGGGTYGAAYAPYRTSPDFSHFSHAHSDLIEWVVETGVVGTMVLLLVGVLLWRWLGPNHGSSSRWWSLGLLGLAIHAIVDFPLQIPGVLVVAVGAAAFRWSAYTPPERTSPRSLRRLLLFLGLAQVPLALWQVRTAAADEASAEVLAFSRSPGQAAAGAKTLARLGSGRPERLLFEAWTAEREGDRQRALETARRIRRQYANDAPTLRRAALVFVREGEPLEGLEVLQRSVERDPNDYRTWALISYLQRGDEDPIPSATAWAEALRHWPWERSEGGAPLREGYQLLPVGLWWLDSLEDAPAYWSAYLGELLVQEGDPELALLAFEQAERLNPVYVDFPPRARALAALGRNEEAEHLLRGRFEKDPTNLRSRFILAELLDAWGRHEEAVDLYLDILQRDPANTQAKRRAIRAAATGGGPEAGLVVGRRILLSGRADAATLLEMARLERAAGRPLRCIELIEQKHLVDDPELGAQAFTLRRECLDECAACSGVP